MGCGDWNDGMNLVGVGGVGESVWVAWFQIVVRTAFAAIAEGRGDRETAERLHVQAKELRSAAEAHAWDGAWYLRAWFDNGTPLGSQTSEECRIDSIAQSWAVFASCEPNRGRMAIEAALDHLVDRDATIVKLMEPPFDHSPLEPGYIKGYLPGIRENGGQYTHASVWLIQALATLGRGHEAGALWRMLSPLTHTTSAEGVTRYKAEPYVVAGDVYGVSPHMGRGGWTWYTGSAAWLYRAALETILGFTIRGNQLTFEPHLPLEWTAFEVEFAFGASIYRCRVEYQPENEGVTEVSLDGNQVPTGVVLLRDDGLDHIVQVVFGRT
jgi:cyclic beta-1,2-glucan synthetase